jgi:hypothetical protein
MLARLCAPIIFKLRFADFFLHVLSATPIGAGCIGAPLVLADYKEDDCVRCVSPIFITNRLVIELYKQETEIRCRKDDGSIKK